MYSFSVSIPDESQYPDMINPSSLIKEHQQELEEQENQGKRSVPITKLEELNQVQNLGFLFFFEPLLINLSFSVDKRQSSKIQTKSSSTKTLPMGMGMDNHINNLHQNIDHYHFKLHAIQLFQPFTMWLIIVNDWLFRNFIFF